MISMRQGETNLFSRTYHSAVRHFAHATFHVWQKLGVHITPVHYYQPLPDTRRLNGNLWKRLGALPGVDLNERFQLDLLSQFVAEYRSEYESFPREKQKEPFQYYVNCGFFESVDGEILYCMVRHFKPLRIVEIGSGFSTYVSAQAVRRNEQESAKTCELVACEPYPNNVLKGGFPGLSRLIEKRVEEIPLSEFTGLEENDILFIDSSHVLKIGADVQYEFLEILPRLKPGVLVHVHDIFLPSEYPKDWVLRDLHFFTEQYLLQAFLAFNSSFEVLWGASFMHLKHPGELEKAFSSYDKSRVWPGSFWMRRIR